MTSFADYEMKLGFAIDERVKGFSEEDQKLARFIASLPAEDFSTLMSVYSGRLFNDLITDAYLKEVLGKGAEILSELDRELGGALAVLECREYAGNTWIFFSEKPHYERVLTRTHKRLGKQHKKAVPEVASVRARESAIASMMMLSGIECLTDEEVSEALKGLDTSSFKGDQRKMLTEALAGGGILYLARTLGKKAVKEIILRVGQRLMAKKLGEEAAKLAAKKLAAKVPQKLFLRAVSFVGWALLVKDAYDLGGEATRITFPFVINVSVLRTVHELGEDQAVSDRDNQEAELH